MIKYNFMDRSGFEPEASCLRSRRSTPDLPALLCPMITSYFSFTFNEDLIDHLKFDINPKNVKHI